MSAGRRNSQRGRSHYYNTWNNDLWWTCRKIIFSCTRSSPGLYVWLSHGEYLWNLSDHLMKESRTTKNSKWRNTGDELMKERIVDIITAIFKRHGAVSLQTPLLIPKVRIHYWIFSYKHSGRPPVLMQVTLHGCSTIRVALYSCPRTLRYHLLDLWRMLV